jgi:hypothetical protein
MVDPETTVTKPPAPDDAGDPTDTGTEDKANQTAVTAQWPGLKQIYLGSMGPQLGFDRLVNILLDNQIFVVNAMNAPPGATESIDLFGLGEQPTEAGKAPKTNWDDVQFDNYNMVDLQSEQGRLYVAKWLHANTTDPTPWAELGNAKQQSYDAEVTKTVGTNRYMYISPAAQSDQPDGEQAWYNTPDKTHIGVVPSFDGTPMGNVRTLEEVLVGMPLDKASLYHMMTNLARNNADYFRGVQAQLGMMGYYGENAASIRWGIAQSMDREAMFGFVSEMLTDHLGVADQARRTGLPLPSLEIDDFIDQKFNDYMGGWISKMSGGGASDPTQDFTDDLEARLGSAAEKKGITVDEAKAAEISQLVRGVLGTGEVDLDPALNKDLMGLTVSDESIATADAFLFGPGGFYGDPENVKIGVQGSHRDIVRLAGLAGVDVETGQAQYGGHRPTLDTEQRKNVARFMFHVINETVGGGNMTTTGNYFANTIGFQEFGSRGFNSDSLTKNIIAAQNPTLSTTFNETMVKQTEERLGAMNDIESRVMNALGTAEDMDRTQRTRAAFDVFRYFSPGTKARKSRVAG